jgi:hypothetical protein
MRREGFRDQIWLCAAVSEVRSETANPSEIAKFSGADQPVFVVCYGLAGGGSGAGSELSFRGGAEQRGVLGKSESREPSQDFAGTRREETAVACSPGPSGLARRPHPLRKVVSPVMV